MKIEESEVEEAFISYKQMMPLLSREINNLSRKELKRILLGVLKYPVEIDKIHLLGEREKKLHELCLAVIDVNKIMWSYSAQLKMEKENVENEEIGSSAQG